jgi:large-conductance mechanosensitive channel
MLKIVNKILTIGKKEQAKEEVKAEPSAEVKLLTEIRDELKKRK